jgi:hypothetical protein
MSDRYYYIGPWVWDTTEGECWRPPDGTVGSIDLRDYEACGLRGTVRGVGLFATDRLLKAPYLPLGTDLDARLDVVQKGGLEQNLSVTLGATTLRTALVELLTQKADPDQARMAAPLGVKSDGTQEIWLAGERIWSKRFEGVTDPAWPMVQAKYQRAYRSVRERALATKSDLHLRFLSTVAAKTKVDPRLLVPGDLPYEDVRRPDTVYTEDWNCSNSADLDCDLDWTEVTGNYFNLVSGKANYGTRTGSRCGARAEHDLSSDDHYAQAVLTDTYSYQYLHPGTAVRYNSSADSYYLGWASFAGDYFRGTKVVNGIATHLGSVKSHNFIGLSYLLKTSIDGDSLTVEVDGDTWNVSDSTFTGQTRGGIAFYSGNDDANTMKWEDFEEGDLGAPPTTSTTTPIPPTTSTTTPAPTTSTTTPTPPTTSTTTPAPPTTSTTTPAPPPTSTTTPSTTEGPAPSTTEGPPGPAVFINDVETDALVLRWIRASYVRPWEAELLWPGRHDAPPAVDLWDTVRIEDPLGTVRFRGNVTAVRPGGVADEGVVYTASDKRFRLENEPVRINGRGMYVWNPRGYVCSEGWGGEDSPGRDGGKWTCGEVIADILEHALGLPGGTSDISGHHGDACCIINTYLTADDIAGYTAADILSLDSAVGEFSVDDTPVAQAIGLLLALNGGFYGWYLDPATGDLEVVDLDALPITDLQAGRLGHWQDEAGTDYVLLGNELEWSLDGVASTVAIQGQDRTVEVRPRNIQDKTTGLGSGNPPQNGGGELEFVAAPWRGWDSAYRALCQPYRPLTGKEIDSGGLSTPPYGMGGCTHLPRVYRGTDLGVKTYYRPTSGINPIWLITTGMIGFEEVPALGPGEKLWGWYWARVPFTVTSGPDGDAYHWYGYQRTRTVYDPSFRHASSWPQPGTPDDAAAMAVLANRLLRIFRDVRRQGTLSCDRVDFDAFALTGRYNLANLGAEYVAGPSTTTQAPTTTEMGGFGNPTLWPALRINAVEVTWNFEDEQTQLTVANTFWMLEEYSELKRRLEDNLFVQREYNLSQNIYDCQVQEPFAQDPTTLEPLTTTEAPAPTTTEGPPIPTTTEGPPPPTTTPAPGSTTSSTSTTEGPTTSTTTEGPGCPDYAWCEDECADGYHVDFEPYYCGWIAPCEPWEGGFGYEGEGIWHGMMCDQGHAWLWCDGGTWWVKFLFEATGGECYYTRPATPHSCPAGLYTLYPIGNSCDDCPDTITVYE